MPIFDRYLIGSFARVYLICLISFAGLFVVIDAFTNLDEILTLSRRESMAGVLAGYYGPRCLQFFDRTAPFLALVASVFCVSRMQRTSELTAIHAAGISGQRVVRPLFISGLFILGLAVVNRELVLPKFRDVLVMNAQDIAGGKGRVPAMTVDHETGLVLQGQEVMPARQTISFPSFGVPPAWGIAGDRIEGESGEWLSGEEDRPAGYLIRKSPQATLAANAGPASRPDTVLVPAVNGWLKPDQVFVATEIDTVELAFASHLVRNEGLANMIAEFRAPGCVFANRLRVDIHGRIVQPFFELSILLIGLPMVIRRSEKNMFLSAGLCMVLATAMSLAVIVSHSLGATRIIPSAVVAAWLPVIVFLPVAWVAVGRLGK